MKPAARERRSWTPGRWTWGVAVVMAAQVMLVLALSDRSPVRRREPTSELRSTLVAAPGAGSAFRELEGLADPTLFALPSARGFAGVGWRQGTGFTYRSEDWTEPVHWLTNQSTLPRLSAPGDSPAVSRSARLEKPGARVSEAAPAPLPVPGRSTLLLHGAIAHRSLRAAPELPSIAHSNLLEDTVVRAGVQADGHVFSAAIARSSRLKAADDRALEIARSARFEPEPGAARASGASALSWGELVFRWHVIPGTAGARP